MSATAAQEYCAVDVSRHGGVTIITVTGEVDIFAAPALVEALDAAGRGAVVVDLSACSFFDSSGLHALLGAQREGLTIVPVCAAGGSPSRMLDVTVGGSFPAQPTREAAFATLAA